jgi:tRNA(His) guanylyltransferase
MGTNGKFKNDELGTRIKSDYENRTRNFLPRRTYTIIRIDGKAFHTYTKGLERPFDMGLIEDMDETACYLCKNIQGAKFAVVKSDEINILMTDFDAIGTDAWFDGNIQKISSVTASMAAAKFNELRLIRRVKDIFMYEGVMTAVLNQKLACFDARTFSIPPKYEVINYFIWRQQDTVRNSISSVAQNLYKNHNDLKGKNMSVQQEMIFQKGINWNDYAPKLKRGRFIEKIIYEKEPDVDMTNSALAIRSKWVSIECPTFTQDKGFLLNRIPDNQ